MRGRSSSYRATLLCHAVVACSWALLFVNCPASASETRGFLVSWFYIAQYYDTQGRDCPHGVNPNSEGIYRRELKILGKSQKEIDDFILTFLDNGKQAVNAPILTMRGSRDGKPANVYTDPESTVDPHIYTVVGPYGYGFNLDGLDKPGDFIDPDTGEHGVDNQLYKATGCTRELRPHSPTEYAPLPTSYWNVSREVMPALLIEVSGIDNYENDDSVTVAIYRAQERTMVDNSGAMLAGSSYHVDPNPRWHNVLHGRIRNGVIKTDPADINFSLDPFLLPEYKFTRARLRLKINADGTLQGKLGAYHAWFPFYFIYGVAGFGQESTTNIDMPGLYYALKRLADADPDPKTGQNRSISLAYQIDAVPAFVIHDNQPIVQASTVQLGVTK
jgi:hypothetical protein